MAFDPCFHAWDDVLDRIFGFLLFLDLAWFPLLKPAWFGLNQVLGRVDPLAEAMAGVRVGLGAIFADLQALGSSLS